MTRIETQSDPDKPLRVAVTVDTEFSMGSASFKKEDLEVWLGKLPAGARCKFIGLSSGHLIIQASWKEVR